MSLTHDLILVSPEDIQVGTMSKADAHRIGALHRAFSILIFDEHGRMLLQRRAQHKYHSGGLWTNACCSHPAPGESTEDAAHRRLQEELGFDCPLTFHYHFIYRAELNNELIEHELDHVYTGIYNGTITPNPNEVEEYVYLDIADISQYMEAFPEQYTVWFKIIFNQYLQQLHL